MGKHLRKLFSADQYSGCRYRYPFLLKLIGRPHLPPRRLLDRLLHYRLFNLPSNPVPQIGLTARYLLPAPLPHQSRRAP